nr:retrovirus-related Pol polyprotein from transposon TNT 1-94 [Tanacetum cinerariifolium]
MQTQTSNTLHNAIIKAGGKDRPPMLASSNYVQWKSIIKRYIDTKPDHELIHYCLKNPQYKFTWADKEVLIFEGSHVTTTETYMETYKNISQDIRDQLNAEAGAHQNEVNEIRAERIAPATRNKGKAIVNSPQPIYDQQPSMVAEDDETSKDKEIDKLTALISLSIGNVAEARETVGSTVVQKSGIQCYNCKEFGHVARECQKPKRVKDEAYHREKMLLCKQDEAGIQLNAEQADWRDDTDDESEDQELEAHYMYMAQIQEVSPDAADSGPIFDSEPVQKVSTDDHYNVFAIESEHPEQSKSVHHTYPIEQDEHNMIIDSLDLSYDREHIDQNDDDNDIANEQLQRRNDAEYASKVEIDCAKAKGDLISYKMESQKSFNKYTQTINDLNQTNSEMKKKLSAHQETISILSQQKEAQSKLYKTREDKELDKVIVLENKVKVLDNIVYKTGQSVQTMNMLNNKCRTSFAKPEFLKKDQRANPRLYDIDEVTNLQCDYLELLEKCDCLEKELSKSQMMSKSFEALQKHAINLEIDLQQCQEKIKMTNLSKKISQKNFAKNVNRVILTTSVSRPQLKSNPIEDRVMLNNSKGKKQEVEDQRRNHDMCVLKSVNGVISWTKMPIVVPVSTREPNCTVKQSTAKPLKKTIASKTTNPKPRNITRKLYERVSKAEIVLFIVYYGCSKHMTGNLKLLINFVEKFLGTVKFRNDQIAPILGYGDLIRSKQSELKRSKEFSIFIVNDVNSRTKMPIAMPLVEIFLFIVDSWCSKHMMGNLKLLINFVEKFLGTMKFRNDQIAPILGYGDLVQGSVTIKLVYYVEGLNHNLFSVGQFCDADLEVAFRKSTCYIRDLKGNDLLIGSRGTDLYSITIQDTDSPNPICLMAKATSSQAWLWHHRLSHLNFDTINSMSKNDIVVGLPKLKFVKDHLCSSCELGKAKRKSFHSKTTPSSKRRLQLLHMDLCGPMRVASINGKRYVIVIVDDYSRYTWTHFLRSKDEIPEVLIDFLRLVQRGLLAQVRIVRTDKGMKFLNKTLHAYFASEGILHQMSVAQTPEQNSVVKRRNRTLVEAARTMLSAAKEKGDACIFVGYSTQPRVYWVFNKRTRVIVETIHVNFDELSQMASDYVSSNPGPQCQRTALEHDSLSFGPQCQENVTQADRTVVSKSSAVSTADAPNQCQQQHTTPLNNQTTPEPTCQVLTQAPTIASTENINHAEMIEEYAQVENNEFINIFYTPIQDRGETLS